MFRFIEFFQDGCSMGYITLEGISWFDIERTKDYLNEEVFIVKAGDNADKMPSGGYEVSPSFQCEKEAYDFLKILIKNINGQII